MNNLIRKTLKENDFINYCYNRLKYIIFKYCFSDIYLVKRKFKKILNRELDLENPIYFNDKIQWLKLNWYDSEAAQCADKYEVRKYVKQKIGERYLNEIYGVYDSEKDIDLDNLPKSFVLKATHGSAWNIICKDKDKVNWNKEFIKIKRWLKTNFFWNNREWVYKDLKPRIICEKYLSDENGNPPKDYKIFCFHGEPKLIQVDIDRFSLHRQNFYDIKWNFIDVQITLENDKDYIVPKPKCLDRMLELSRKLSEKFPHVRVDFYIDDNRIIFGELTFFHHAGTGIFRPKEFEVKMGEWIKLPKKEADYKLKKL